jgi:hypothetical protein
MERRRMAQQSKREPRRWRTPPDGRPLQEIASTVERGLDLARIPHRTEFTEHHGKDGTVWWSVVFFETEAREVFPSWINPNGLTTPRDFWFSLRVEPADPGDCDRCGSTGRDFYNPFRDCTRCAGRGRLATEVSHD